MSNPIIVYVEDDPNSRQVMSVLLRRILGYDAVYIFEDSTDFIERLEGLGVRPDIIFLDIHMKPHNGFELLDMLREHPDFYDCTIIALTASVMNEEILRLQTASFDGGIAKPINQKTFRETLEQILNGERVWYIK